MKETEALIKEYDYHTVRAATRITYRDIFVTPRLLSKIADHKAACGFDATSAQVKEVWLTMKKDLSPADEATLLLDLTRAGLFA